MCCMCLITDHSVDMTSPKISDLLSNNCLMERAGQCIALELKGDGDVGWVMCEKCTSWYHCACVGMNINSSNHFVCCGVPDATYP